MLAQFRACDVLRHSRTQTHKRTLNDSLHLGVRMRARRTSGSRHMPAVVRFPRRVPGSPSSYLIHLSLAAHDAKQHQVLDDIPDLDGPSADDIADGVAGVSLGGNADSNPPVGDIPDMDEIPDMEEAGIEEEDDAAVVAPPTNTAAGATTSGSDTRGNLLSVRTYDVIITYDKYYQTPRVWLLGYDEVRLYVFISQNTADNQSYEQKGNALTHKQVFEDISAEHAQKTVTIEAFPHSATLSCASVHPCKHASVMKKVIERMNAHVIEEQRKAAGKPSTPAGAKESGGSNKRKWLLRKVTGDSGKSTPAPNAEEGEDIEGMRVDFYLVVFLKFIASIVPTIEVDSTTAL